MERDDLLPSEPAPQGQGRAGQEARRVSPRFYLVVCWNVCGGGLDAR